MSRKQGKQGRRAVIASNRRARYDYTFEDEYEAGIVLTGSEVKSLREGQAQLKEAYGLVRRGEVWLAGMHIAPYRMARDGGHDPTGNASCCSIQVRSPASPGGSGSGASPSCPSRCTGRAGGSRSGWGWAAGPAATTSGRR